MLSTQQLQDLKKTLEQNAALAAQIAYEWPYDRVGMMKSVKDHGKEMRLNWEAILRLIGTGDVLPSAHVPAGFHPVIPTNADKIAAMLQLAIAWAREIENVPFHDDSDIHRRATQRCKEVPQLCAEIWKLVVPSSGPSR
jgi:hypothetical protein